jgi:lipopolysaccharide transport system ATP-binding protein
MGSEKIAISVKGLGKKYSIGGPQEKYLTFRDAIVNSVKAPFRRLSSSEPPREFWALKDVSFDIEQGEVVGIIGRNGAGKSTLLKILSRITSPSEGTVDLYGRVGSLLEVGTGFHPELTGRENIFLSGSILGMKKREIEGKLDEIVKFSEIEKFLDTPAKRYSSGMYVRLAFAVAAHMDTEILLVDEVLAVGDAAFQKKCLGKMGDVAAKEGRTVMFVSHNMGAVSSLCENGLLLSNGKIICKGPINQVIENYLINAGVSSVNIQTSGSLINNPNRKRGFDSLLVGYYIETKNGTIFFGESLKIRIKYDFKKRVFHPQFYIIFDSANGTRIFSLNSDWQKNNLPEFLIGIGEVECTIQSIPLMPGSYNISLQLWQLGNELDNIENVSQITVEWLNRDFGQSNWQPGHGVIYTDAVWNLQPSKT